MSDLMFWLWLPNLMERLRENYYEESMIYTADPKKKWRLLKNLRKGIKDWGPECNSRECSERIHYGVFCSLYKKWGKAWTDVFEWCFSRPLIVKKFADVAWEFGAQIM